jgi:hypothetical protein
MSRAITEAPTMSSFSSVRGETVSETRIIRPLRWTRSLS